MHPRNAGYEPGNYWAVCDRCGIDHRISEMKETWDGLLVCERDWEPRHPQEFIRAVADKVAPDGDIRPPPAQDTFVQVNYIISNPNVLDGTFGDYFSPVPPDTSGFSSGFDSGFN